MIKHPRTIEGYSGSLEKLAQNVGNMAYDCVSLFIEELARDIRRQAYKDHKKNRKQLVAKLYATAEELDFAKSSLHLAWEICKPYVEDSQNP